MASELLVVPFALVLLFYWFRYNCLAILRSTPPSGHARQVATANQLSFLEVREELQNEPSPRELDHLHASLNRDYRVLTCLLRYTSALRPGSYTVEQRMLMLDFRLMTLWYALTRTHLRRQAQRSVEERAHILSYFAHAMGERALSRA
jgi:hypothetical protein